MQTLILCFHNLKNVSTFNVEISERERNVYTFYDYKQAVFCVKIISVYIFNLG